MKKLLATILTLAMCCSVAAPALAYQDTDPPLWKQWGFGSLEEMLEETYSTEEEYGEKAQAAVDQEAWREVYWAQHSAGFDADAWYERYYSSDYDAGKEEYMEWMELDEAGFQEEMKDSWLNWEYWNYESQQKVDAWAAEHPEEYAAFDPDQYFVQVFNARGYWTSKKEYMETPPKETEEEFRLDMLGYMVRALEEAERQQAQIDAWAAEHPEEFAAFDPQAWFDSQEGEYWTVEEYMEVYDLSTPEDFDRYVTWTWVDALDWVQRRQDRADAWAAEHPEEAAAFDPDQWFEDHTFSTYYDSKEAYMETLTTGTQEEFRTNMLLDMLVLRQEIQEARELVETWSAEHPEEYAAFDAEAWLEKSWNPYGETPEEYMAVRGLTQEEFQLEMARNYIESWETAQQSVQAWADQMAAEPQDTAAFLAEADTWVAEYYYSYDSMAGYIEEWGYMVPEEAYLELYSTWKRDRDWKAREQAKRDEHKRELGGIPGELSVMLNGSYIQFPDAKPVARDQRTMIPIRALAEAMGYQVTFDPDQSAAVCVKGDVAVAFPVGDSAYTVTAAGETWSGDMGAAAFAEDGRIYIPLRALGEALSCDVAWDGDYDTAVLFDVQAISDTLNEHFTQLDQMVSTLAGKALDAAQRNIETTASETIRITLFNSLDGDKSYEIKLKATTTAGKGAVECEVELDLVRLLSQLTAEDWADLKTRMEDNDLGLDLDVDRLKSLLKNGVTLKLFWNAPEGTLYVQCPLLALFYPRLGEEDWVSVDVGDLAGAYTEVIPGAALPTGPVDKNGQAESLGLLDIGAYLYDQEIGQWVDRDWAWRAPGVDSYAQLMETAQPYVDLLGNDRFTRADGKVTYTLETQLVNDVIREAAAPDPDDYYSYDFLKGRDLFQDCQVALTVYDDGDCDVDMKVRTNPRVTSVLDFLFTWKGRSQDGTAAQELEFHFKNLFDLTADVKAQTRNVRKAPAALPPEEAAVIPWELLDW